MRTEQRERERAEREGILITLYAIEFEMTPTSVTFLAESGFDFNFLFSHALTYCPAGKIPITFKLMCLDPILCNMWLCNTRC